MKPSSGVRYALTALVDLALHQQTGPVTVASIAKRQGIPAPYLEQLFNRLRREGLVVAERGPRGGYRLSRSPKEIPVAAIFRCLGDSSDKKVLGTGLRPEPDTEPAAAVWKQVETAVEATLEATPLETLVAQAREKNPSPIRHPFTFHI